MTVFSDFEWSWKGVRVKETGAVIAFNPALVWDVLRGGHYICREAIRSRASELPFRVTYDPRAPRPWYLLWGVLRQAGIRRVGEPAVLTIHFSDTTTVNAPRPQGKTLNGHCVDISKSHVAKVFQQVFGYSLSLDPAQTKTPYLEKGEENGIHDAQIRETPMRAEPGRVYQKLIDNRTPDGTVLDYRCPSVFGDIPLVFLKERPIDKRFANLNTRVRTASASDCFSPEELEQIRLFCAEMHLDWGGLDILRDAADGRIYIVDVNKTDMGPPLALPINEKLSAVKTLGLALRNALSERL